MNFNPDNKKYYQLLVIILEIYRCLSDGDPYACDYMGLYAFSSLNGTKPKEEFRQLYLLTDDKKPFCSSHYRVSIVLSDTIESLKQGGDR